MATKKSSGSRGPRQAPNARNSAARQRDAARARKDKARSQEYKAKLRQLTRTGVYSPKSPELTRYRKARINRLVRELGPLVDDTKTLFFKAPKAAIKGAKDAGFVITRKGFFLPREREAGHPIDKAKLIRRKGRQRYDVIGTRKTKSGKTETYVVALAGTDALMRSRANLDDLLYTSIGKNRRYRFLISDRQGSYMSHRAFTNPEDLWDYALRYRKTKGDQVAFMDKLTIVVVERAPGRRSFDRIVDNIGHISDTSIDPELLRDMEEEAEEDEEGDNG